MAGGVRILHIQYLFSETEKDIISVFDKIYIENLHILNSDTPVIIYCKNAILRSVSFCVYLLLKMNYTLEESYAIMKHVRPEMSLSNSFRIQLAIYGGVSMEEGEEDECEFGLDDFDVDY